MRYLRSFSLFLLPLLCLPQLVSAAPHGVSAAAEGIIGPEWFTNSMLMAVIACALISFFVIKAMGKREMIPSGKQNFVEMLVEFLYGQVENIVGKKVAPKAFPLLGSIFIFILVSNYMGLVPGVGTVGAAHGAVGALYNTTELTPALRASTADMNMTVGIAIVATVIWLILTLSELGLMGFLAHTFGPKGGLKGGLKFALMPLFFFVGIIEIVSIIFRPVSLSFRLYGNIFAGENLLHTMSSLLDKTGPVGAFIGATLLPIPFYFMEVLVGLLQAMVFTLLMAVYIQLSTSHDEEHGEHDHGDHDHAGHSHKEAATAA